MKVCHVMQGDYRSKLVYSWFFMSSDSLERLMARTRTLTPLPTQFLSQQCPVLVSFPPLSFLFFIGTSKYSAYCSRRFLYRLMQAQYIRKYVDRKLFLSDLMFSRWVILTLQSTGTWYHVAYRFLLHWHPSKTALLRVADSQWLAHSHGFSHT
jgi:hypothetical protein